MNENEHRQAETVPENEAAKQKNAQMAQRRRLVQMLAGGYLIYLAYQLISGVMQEIGWTRMKIAGLIAGILFGVSGAAFLILNLAAELKQAKTMAEPKENDKGDGEQ